MGQGAALARPPVRTGKGLARSRGLAILATVAAAGAVLVRPGAPAEPPVAAEVSADPPALWLILAAAPRGSAPAGTLIVSRVPSDFDPRRSLLRLEDGRLRIVPRGARSVLVLADGRVEAFREPLLADPLLRRLRSLPPAGRAASLREWASGTQPFPHGTGIDERLRRFLLDS